MAKYNFTIYSRSGIGTVVDVQSADDPSNVIQARLDGHVVFRREAGKIQPIVTFPAPNNGTPYSLEQDGQYLFHERMDDVAPNEMFFFMHGPAGWDLYIEESLAGLSLPAYIKHGKVDREVFSLPLSKRGMAGRCYIEEVYTSSTLNLTGGTVVEDMANDAEPIRVRYNKIRSQLQRKGISADERELLSRQTNQLRRELKELCHCWVVRMARPYARRARA